MEDVRILLTGVGCPGAATVIGALRNNGERPVHIIGADMRPTASGRWFVDEFYTVPPGDSPEFIKEMLRLAQRTRPGVILPQLSYEVQAWACARHLFNCPVMVSSPNAVHICSDKLRTYKALEESGVPLPKYYLCETSHDFKQAVLDLGHPDKPVCFKPLVSKGMRGFHILSYDGDDRRQALLEGRPGEMRPTLSDVMDLLGGGGPFPPLLVMEYVEGQEFSADVFCKDGRILMGFVKTREDFRAGLAMRFRVLNVPESVWRQIEAIAKTLRLDYFANIQFKGDKLMEVNPRISTMMIQPDFNMPWLAVKYVLGMADEEELKAASKRVRATTRSVRYFDQIFYEERNEDEKDNGYICDSGCRAAQQPGDCCGNEGGGRSNPRARRG